MILVNIVPSWDIEGRELAIVRRYPIEGQYITNISVITLLLYSFIYLFRLQAFLTFKTLF